MYELSNKVQLSVIIPVYNEEDNIEELYFRVVKVLEGIKKIYEIVFVDDGSIDKSFEVLGDIYNKNGTVKIVRLTRNFGQAAALLAGFSFARGEIVVTIDADLQCLPEDIPKLLTKINEGFDAVSGFRRFRQDTIFRKSSSYLMNKIMYFKTKINLKDWGCPLNMIRKELIDQIISYGSNARFIKPLGVRLGKNITEVEVQHLKRKNGRSKYNILSLISNGLDFLVNYSRSLSKDKREIFIVKEIIQSVP